MHQRLITQKIKWHIKVKSENAVITNIAYHPWMRASRGFNKIFNMWWIVGPEWTVSSDDTSIIINI